MWHENSKRLWDNRKVSSFLLHLWQWRNGHRCPPITNVGETPLDKFQRLRAFITSLPIDKRMMMIKKASLRHWEQLPNFFIPPLPIFVWGQQNRSQTLVHHWKLRSQCPIAIRGGAVILHDYHTMGTGEIRWKSPRLSLLFKTFQNKPLSARSISMDNTFKGRKSRSEL